MLVTVLFIFASLVGLFAGNLQNLMQPYDEFGTACGRASSKASNYPFLFLTTLDPKKWGENNVCVKECPEKDGVKIDCLPNKRVRDCNRDIKTVSTTLYMGRFCYPDGETLEDEIKKETAKQSGKQGFVDIKNSWILILIAFILSIIFGVLFLYSVRLCAATTITVIALSLIAVMVLLGMYFMRQFSRGNEMQFKTNDPYTWFLFATAICWLFAVIFGIVFFCFVYDKVKVSAKVMEISSFYLTENKKSLIIPVINAIVFLLYLTYYIIAGAYLATIGTPHVKEGVPFGTIEWTATLK